VNFFDADGLTRQRSAEINFLFENANSPAVSGQSGAIVEGVRKLADAAIGPRGRFIDVGGARHFESFMRKFVAGASLRTEAWRLSGDVWRPTRVLRRSAGPALDVQIHLGGGDLENRRSVILILIKMASIYFDSESRSEVVLRPTSERVYVMAVMYYGQSSVALSRSAIRLREREIVILVVDFLGRF